VTTAEPRGGPLETRPRTGAPVPYAGVVLLLFASTALRLPATFLYPSFWAEDLTVFFREGVEIGPAAFLRPMYGSYHALPRLSVLLASLLPVAWAPAVYALCAGLVSSASLALFSRPGFRWLVPQDRVRALVCWLFSLVPGTNEGFFALCTSNYAVFCGAMFLLLERGEAGRWRMGLPRALLVSFLWFSLGQGVVLALPLACLFGITRNRSYLVCLGSLGVSLALNLAAENSYRPEELPGPVPLALVYLENLFVRLGFVPLLPHRWIGAVRRMPDLLFFPLSALLLAGYVGALARRRVFDAEGARVLAVTVLSAMAIFPLTALARSYGLPMLRRPEVYLGGRAALVPSVVALVLLWSWLARPARGGRGRAAAAALLAWTTLNVLFEPLYARPWPFRPFVWEWPRQSAAIERALRDRRAGRLREPVVVRDIHCRPDSPVWKVTDLNIAPSP